MRVIIFCRRGMGWRGLTLPFSEKHDLSLEKILRYTKMPWKAIVNPNKQADGHNKISQELFVPRHLLFTILNHRFFTQNFFKNISFKKQNWYFSAFFYLRVHEINEIPKIYGLEKSTIFALHILEVCF